MDKSVVMNRKYKIAVAGTGYVGLSLAVLLAQHHTVYAVDIVPEKVAKINAKQSPIQDDYIEKYLAEKDLDLTATLDAKEAYTDADYVVIAAPTNYDSEKNYFDTSAVETVIDTVMKYAPDAIMVIKSTIPVGYTESIRGKTSSNNIMFSPEFLRESKALYDNLYPSRIIVGTDMEDARLVEAAHTFAELLQEVEKIEGLERIRFMTSHPKDLSDELLEMVDTKQIAFNPGVELSYLKDKEQLDFLEAMDYAQAAPSLSQAQRLKKLSQDGLCTFEAMCAVMGEEKKGDICMSETVMQALEIMGKGMLGIFVALIVIMVFVWIMAKLGKKKD